jgi:hypothetical protein
MTQLSIPAAIRHRREPALAELLADPIVVALMRADGVGRIALEASLRDVALALPARRSSRSRNTDMRGHPS